MTIIALILIPRLHGKKKRSDIVFVDVIVAVNSIDEDAAAAAAVAITGASLTLEECRCRRRR